MTLSRHSGFSLAEIAETFGADGPPQIDRQQVLAKAHELDETIERLTAMRENLRHVAACAAPDHLSCPKFRSLLGAATDLAATVLGERRSDR